MSTSGRSTSERKVGVAVVALVMGVGGVVS